MITVKKAQLLIVIFSAIFFWSACTNDTQNETTNEITEAPPSISGNSGELEIIQLSDNELAELNIETALVTSDIQNYSLQAPGVVFPASNYVSVISTPIDGRISNILIKDGEYVTKGQEIFMIESLDFGNMISDYLQAVAEEKYQISRMERLEQLVEQTISSASELEKATSEYQRAVAVSISAHAKLKAIGVSDDDIEALKTAEVISPSLHIHAPISGSFDQRMVELGQSVNALDQLGRVLNLNKVLIKAYVSPEDARFVNPGDKVTISLRENDEMSINSVVSSVNPGLDEDNRSVVVNIEAEPQNSWPKPGENVRVEINTSTTGEVFAVPVKAITYDGNDAIVFIKKDANTFEKRTLEIDNILDDYAFVTNGINENEELAVSQVFSLKALSRFELISEE